MRFADFLLSWDSASLSTVRSRCDVPRELVAVDAPASQLTLWRGSSGAGLCAESRVGSWRYWRFGEAQVSTDDDSATSAQIEKSGCDPLDPVLHDGRCLLLGYDDVEQEWHLWTDRFGTVHAYYGFDGKHAAVGTFFPAVAASASRRELDWDGLTSYFAFGFFLLERTFFDDVRILPPASHVVFDRSGVLRLEERYWKWSYRPDRVRSYSDTVEEFAAIWGSVIERQTATGRIAIPISGGLDSRSVVAALGNGSGEAQRLWAFSYGYGEESRETRIAGRVARAADLRFEQFSVGPYLFDEIDQVLDFTEGFTDLTQCRQASVASELSRSSEFVLAAHWGDVWLDTVGLSKEVSLEGLISKAWAKCRKRGAGWLFENLCEPRLGAVSAETLLRRNLAEALERVRYLEEPEFCFKAFLTDQWSFRWTLASVRMYQAGSFPRLPFYDNRMADFFCTVPSEYLAGRRLQIDYLKRTSPELAAVTWQAYDSNLYRYQAFDTWQLPRRALKKAGRLLGERVLGRLPERQRNWEVQFLREGGRDHLEDCLLHRGRSILDFVPRRRIRELLDELYLDPQPERGYAVSMLLTFATWLERHA